MQHTYKSINKILQSMYIHVHVLQTSVGIQLHVAHTFTEVCDDDDIVPV